MNHHQAPLASDWHRLTALYSVRFEMVKLGEGVFDVNAIWSTDQPPPPRAMEELSTKFNAALNAFVVTSQQPAIEGGKA